MSFLKMSYGASKTNLDRRGFLRLMFWVGLIGYSSKPAFAAIDYLLPEERFLSLYNPSTKENFDGIYWRNGDYVADALNKINNLMRDIQTDAVKQIDKDLLDLIFAISIKLKPQKPFHVICGYDSRSG